MNSLNSVLIKLLTVMLISFFIISCEKDYIKDKADDTAGLSTNNSKLLSYLTDDLNLDATKINEDGKAFYYDGCMVFPKNRLANYLDTDKNAKHSKWGFLLETGTYHVQFDSSVPDNWKNETKNAMNDWNNLNGHIRFSVTSDGTLGTVNVSYNDFRKDGFDNNSACANAYPPPIAYDGYIGNININNVYSANHYSNSQKRSTMVHELGHFLGLMHPNHDGDFLYTGDSHCDWHNDNDTKTVMYAYGCSHNWNGFTTCDIAAYEALYERVFIKSNNNKYLCSENGGTWAIANRTALGDWEKFKLKKNSDGSYSIMGSNYRYADIDRGAGQYVKFNNTDRYCGDCKFWVNHISGDIYSIQSVATGKFLSSKGGSDELHTANLSIVNIYFY